MESLQTLYPEVVRFIIFFFGLVSLIFVHELGHFLVAKALKVKSDEFGIGFPPRMFGTAHDLNGQRRWFGAKTPEDIDPDDMILSFNWLPLGGFVRLRGEADPGVPGGFGAAGPWTRLAIAAAGPIVNLIVGMILAVILFQTYGAPDREKVLIYAVNSGAPAEQAGIQAGDLVMSFNNEPINSMDELITLTGQHLGESVNLVLERGGATVSISLIPRPTPPEGEGAMGITLTNPIKQLTVIESIEYGFTTTFESIRDLVLLPVHIAQGKVKASDARPGGYKFMYDIYREVDNPLWFFTIISISLGVMNLLPIPALDGGRILFTLPELLFRRRIPSEVENTIHAIFLILLVLLVIFINVMDFVAPIQLPK